MINIVLKKEIEIMTKIAIAFKILDILLDERIHKRKELREKLELKDSTLRSYINDLIIAGFEIESYRGRYGGYSLTRRHCVNSIINLIKVKQTIDS